MSLIRHPGNPLITRSDITHADVSSVFNPGVIRFAGRTHAVLRVQTRGRRTQLVPATSDDGVTFNVGEPLNVPIDGFHVYDPRLTEIEGRVFMALAVDTDTGCRMAIASTDTFTSWDWHGLTTDKDTRNGVLFPERLNGKYARLHRPNGQGGSGDTIWFSTSTDLLSWTEEGEVMRGCPHFWDERIGSGPPPIRTSEGWLHIYHGVATHFASVNLYQAGVVLLDSADPTIVRGRSTDNILEPREMYELTGQVPNVVFPSGWTIDGSRVAVYYGAADTVVARADTTIEELLQECL